MNKKLKRFLICIAGIIVLVLLDQLTKHWAVIRLSGKEPIPIIPGVLELHYLDNGNTGAAFGILKGQQWIFLTITVVMSVFLLYLIYNIPENRRYRVVTVIFTFIVAGGTGNLIDRVRLKYVIDFIYIKIINFPLFNIADMCVSLSAVLLLILSIFHFNEEDFALLEDIIKKPFKKNKKETFDS